jgi:hypothetical protein
MPSYGLSLYVTVPPVVSNVQHWKCKRRYTPESKIVVDYNVDQHCSSGGMMTKSIHICLENRGRRGLNHDGDDSEVAPS